ncbi:MAG: hypothetical protein PHF84_06010 [bacterium]|nr:hypothetical protein [bacterium]
MLSRQVAIKSMGKNGDNGNSFQLPDIITTVPILHTDIDYLKDNIRFISASKFLNGLV